MTNANGKLIAIIFSALLITGTVAPVVALGPQGAGNAGNTAGNAPSDRFGTDPVADDPPPRADPQNGTLTPPRERIELAQFLLRAVETDRRGDFSNRKRAALSRLNDSLDSYRDDYRVDSHRKFLRDAHATSRLTRFAETDNATTINVTTAQLLWADRDTAALAIEEANRAVSQSEGRVDPNRLRRARKAIRQAERTFDRADRNVERGLDDSRQLDRQIRSRSRAIKQYGRSWKRAQRALRVLDRYVAPELQVSAGPDQVWNGTGTQNRTLRGNVTGIQPWELSDLRVQTGNGTRTIPLDTSTAPASTTNFTVRVETTERVTNLTVEVVDPIETNEGSGRQDPQIGRDSVAFDGDGLSSSYERSVTETDPLDFDSDSTRTNADEADDGVIDGAEDFDEDGVGTLGEAVYKLDPFVADTDGDGLSDGTELQYSALDPRSADSDDDGTLDPAEDFDNDTLSTERELDAGTRPTAEDTDADMLSDAAELEQYDTNATLPDTDGDGLLDGVEIELGTDPTDPDSDGDGVEDGNETYTSTAENDSLGVSVGTTGEGLIAAGVTIESENDSRLTRGAVAEAGLSPLVELDSARAFDSANVTFEYDESAVPTDESNLGVYRYNRTTQTYDRLPSEVDTESNTVTGETPHFSRFIVLDSQRWNDSISALPDLDPDGTLNESSVVRESNTTYTLTQDGTEYSVEPISTTQTVEEYYGYSNRQSDSLTGLERPDTSLLFLYDGPRGVSLVVIHDDPRDGTDGKATFEFTGLPSSGKWVVIDGPGDFSNVRDRSPDWAWAPNKNDGGAYRPLGENVSIGITPKFNEAGERNKNKQGEITSWELISGNASEPTRSELNLTEPVVLSRGNTTVRVGNGTDSDGDGLSDRLERQGIPTGTGERIVTDPYDADTDGDGIPDGEEVNAGSVATTAGGEYYTLDSDPTAVDSDGDGLSDAEEREGHTVALATSAEDAQAVLSTDDPAELDDILEQREVTSDPLYADTDEDGLSDLNERLNRTDPRTADSDGDTVSDGREVLLGADPTLHDYKPPEISVWSAKFGKKRLSGKVTYVLRYNIDDTSGTARTAISKGGSERFVQTFDGARNLGVSASFETSFAETFLDGVTGAKVQITATDVHGNTKSIVGLERANFYGSLAGKLDSQNIFTSTIAFQLGELSGFATSLGTVAKSVVTLIQRIAEDPLFVVETIRQLVEVVRNLSADVLEQIVESAITQFQQKQDRNNPYEQTQKLYGEYESGWYIGYAAGFLAKTAVGASATKALKSTKTVQKITRRLSSTRVGSVLAKVDSVRDAAKARVATAIVRSVDDVPGGYIGEASSVGQVYRLWRTTRGVDANLGELSNLQQRRLARAVAQGGADTASAIRRLGLEALDDLTNFDVGVRTRSVLALRYAELDADRRAQLSQVLDGDPDAALNAARLDDEGLRDALDYSCGLTVTGVSAGAGVTPDRQFSLSISTVQQCSVQTDLDAPMWRVDSDVRSSLADRLDTDEFGRLVQSNVPETGLKAIDDLDTVSAVRRVDGEVKIDGEKYGIETELGYPDDTERFYLDNSDAVGSVEELRDLSSQQIGSDVVEADIAPKLVERRGWDVLYADEKGGTDPGIDLIARDNDGNIVVTEVKFTRKSDTPGKGLLGSTRELDSGEDARQMTNDWIDDAFNDEIADGEFDGYDEVRTAIQTDNYRKEVIVVQDGRTTRTLTGGLNDYGIDRVSIIRTGEVTK